MYDLEFDNLDIPIRDVQKVQLELLREFDRICKKHNIKYQLFAGTLLGAVRHKGFIPWDDDIDVCLLREDYNKFLEVCKSDLDPQYFLQTYETDKNYILQIAKIRKNNTLFVQNSYSECQIHHGIFIDIFPMDNILPNTFRGKVQQKLLYIAAKVNPKRVRKRCLNAKNPINKYLNLLCYYVLKIIPNKWMNRTQTKIACMFQDKQTKYVSSLFQCTSKARYMKYMIEKDTFYDTIDGEFEGYVFPIPRNYHCVLSRVFGDYTKFPPVEERKPHHGIIEIDFDTTNN